MTFSATDAAFRGFKLIGARLPVMAAWCALYAVVFLVLGGAFWLIAGESYLSLLRSAGTPGSLDDFAGVFGRIMLGGLLLVLIGGFISAVFTAGVYRLVLRPEEGGFFHLRVGADEVRLFVVGIVVWLLLMLAVGAPILLIAAVARTVGDAQWLVWLVGVIAMICLAALLSVRLSMAGPMTFAERRFRLFESWDVTRGRFWPLLGMLVLVVMFLFLLTILASVVTVPFQAMFTMSLAGAFQGGQSFDLEALRGAVTPMAIVGVIGYVVVTLVQSVVQLAVTYAPAADAYRQITGPKPDSVGEIFG